MVGKGKVKILRTQPKTIRVPQTWMESFQWRTGDKILVTAGKRVVRAKIQSHKKPHISLSQDLIEQLYLPPVPISWKIEIGQIRFGPFVAAYTIHSGRTKDPFAGNTGVFQDMTILAKELHVPFYVISAGGLDQEKQIAHSWMYDDRMGNWRQTEYPWPDFFIKKNIYTPAKWKRVIQQEAAWLEMDHRQMLSRNIGSKWDVYRILLDDPVLASHLPLTKRIQTLREVSLMLKRFPVIYMKPVWGTQGKHIYRLIRLQGGKVKLQHQDSNQQIRSLQLSVNKNYEWFRKKILVHGDFLVQQGIGLITDSHNRPADFRWLMQKDGAGEWSVTARVARIAKNGNLTTNVSTGGDVLGALDFLRDAGMRPEKMSDIIQKMDDLSIRIVNHLEQQVGSMGELGIDFGLDQTGKPWVIEVNPRPGRKMLKMLNQKLRELSLRRPLEYAKYTVGFSDRSIF